MGVIGEAGRVTRGLVAVAYRARAEAPLVAVRASGDSGHDPECARDHLIPGVCVVDDVRVARTLIPVGGLTAADIERAFAVGEEAPR